MSGAINEFKACSGGGGFTVKDLMGDSPNGASDGKSPSSLSKIPEQFDFFTSSKLVRQTDRGVEQLLHRNPKGPSSPRGLSS